jgi:phosphate:Na+ symporter
MSLAARGVVPPNAAFALVLGANLGSALNPVLEGARGGDGAARQLPFGNLINRALGCGVALAALPAIGVWMVRAVPDNARAVADFHTLFNVVTAVVFFPLLGPYAALLRRWFPVRIDQADPSRPVYLHGAVREVPAVAVGAAAREALRMADVLQTMLSGARGAFATDDRRQVGDTRRMDDVLDRLNQAIKTFLGGLDGGAMSDADHRRVEQILTFALSLEHAGDVVANALMTSAAKRQKRGLSFAARDQAEVLRLLDRLIANAHAAASVFMTEDVRAARLLAAEKEWFRDAEAAATRAHFDRLREGQPCLAEASALQLDVLRDLKQVNAHLVAAAAYPVLKNQGDLLPSRLRLGG